MQRASILLLALLTFVPDNDQQPPTLTNPPGPPGLTGTPQGTAILRIEDARAATPQDVALLIESARSSQLFIQHAALRALGRLERRDVVTDLLPYLRSSSSATRTEAANAIAQAMQGDRLPLDPAGTQVDGVLTVFVDAIASEREAPVLAEMARSMARLPFERPEQVLRADGLLGKVLVLSGELTLGRAGSSAPAAIAGAASALELLARKHITVSPLSENTVDQLRALATGRAKAVGSPNSVRSARRLGFQALVAARGLDADGLRTNLTFADDEMVRRLAMQALAGGGSLITGPDRADHLRRGLKDPSYFVRAEALRGYIRHQVKADGCLPITEMLVDPSEHVVLAALDALGDACGGDEKAANRLIGEARTPPDRGSWRRESHALVALAKRSPANLAIPLLSHSRHNTWQVRMYAARAAAAANEIATLERLAYDDHDNVREATLMPLKRLKGNAAEPYFVAALGRSDYQLLRTAAREMNGMRVTAGATGALLDALKQVTSQRRDTSRDTRVALLERLREFGAERHREQLLPLLRDFDPDVAAAAATTLNAWTGEAFAIDPQPLTRPTLPSVAEIAIVTVQEAVLVMESGREIPIALDPTNALMTSIRLLRLTKANYFDNLTFHRIVTNFIVQGGSPGANEYMGDGPYLRDEISLRSNARGTVGLSTRGRDTGDAQFFINLVDNPRLDFDYTVFGRIPATHMSVVDEIQEGDRIIDVKFQRAPASRR
ncbi:MAG: peptidylprolyl isomerase [Acidobacteria bacterium]|nr:peptidylprolyl isomerase [Acidobacteriota bacterium]